MKRTNRKIAMTYEPETVEDQEIIDRETLVGSMERIPAPGASLTSDNADSLINEKTGNSRNDTGLYELYKNVVERFVNAMIEQAEYFAGERGIAGEDAPTLNWYARTGEGATGCWPGTTCLGSHGPGMSYCFGCKNSIAEYNNGKAANCKAETTAVIKNRETDGITGNEYRGNLGNNCAVGSGTLDWAGLFQDELKYKADQPFRPEYWAGIDCSGLVQRVGQSAKGNMGNIIGLLNLDRNSCQFFYSDAVCANHINNKVPLRIIDEPSRFAYNFGVNDGMTNNPQVKIRKGDLVSYQHHITIVHSEKPSCTTTRNSNDKERTSCIYEIIHAYGGDTNGMYRYPDIPEASADRNRRVFGRKVIRTWQNIGNPVGFGRIKLWE